MLYKTRGIVLRTIKYSETSVVSRIYTEKFGIQSYLINGVRSSRSRLHASLLQTAMLLQMEVYYREHKNLNRVKEIVPAYHYSHIPFEPLKGAIALFLMEVFNKSVKEEESNLKLFDFVFHQLILLDEIPVVNSSFLTEYVWQLIGLLGFSIQIAGASPGSLFHLKEGHFVQKVSPGDAVLPEADSVLLLDFMERKKTLPAGSRGRLLQIFFQFMQYHVSSFSAPKSLKVLAEVFRDT